MHRLEKEMKAAEHLLYVSLKYTKTCDVILNLIYRWKKLVEIAIDMLLEKAKKRKQIKVIPENPRSKMDAISALLKKEEIVVKTMTLYLLFRRIPTLEVMRECEFRKNVTLRVLDKEEIEINLDKLKEWQDVLENFIKFVGHYLA